MKKIYAFILMAIVLLVPLGFAQESNCGDDIKLKTNDENKKLHVIAKGCNNVPVEIISIGDDLIGQGTVYLGLASVDNLDFSSVSPGDSYYARLETGERSPIAIYTPKAVDVSDVIYTAQTGLEIGNLWNFEYSISNLVEYAGYEVKAKYGSSNDYTTISDEGTATFNLQSEITGNGSSIRPIISIDANEDGIFSKDERIQSRYGLGYVKNYVCDVENATFEIPSSINSQQEIKVSVSGTDKWCEGRTVTFLELSTSVGECTIENGGCEQVITGRTGSTKAISDVPYSANIDGKKIGGNLNTFVRVGLHVELDTDLLKIKEGTSSIIDVLVNDDGNELELIDVKSDNRNLSASIRDNQIAVSAKNVTSNQVVRLTYTAVNSAGKESEGIVSVEILNNVRGSSRSGTAISLVDRTEVPITQPSNVTNNPVQTPPPSTGNFPGQGILNSLSELAVTLSDDIVAIFSSIFSFLG